MSDCDATSIYQWGAKDPDDSVIVEVNFEGACARQRSDKEDFAAGERIRVYSNSAARGFEYESSGGRIGAREPRWPTTLDETVVDGSITWTCKALSDSSLTKTISGIPTWTADAGITITGATISGLIASATLSGGTDGTSYTVLVKATFSDSTSLTVPCVMPVQRAT